MNRRMLLATLLAVPAALASVRMARGAEAPVAEPAQLRVTGNSAVAGNLTIRPSASEAIITYSGETGRTTMHPHVVLMGRPMTVSGPGGSRTLMPGATGPEINAALDEVRATTFSAPHGTTRLMLQGERRAAEVAGRAFPDGAPTYANYRLTLKNTGMGEHIRLRALHEGA